MRNWAAISFVLLLGAGGFAYAQGGSGTRDDSDDDGDGEDASADVQRRADLTPEEQLAEAEHIQTNAHSLQHRVMGMLDEGRREGDVVRVTCVDDKLTQINAHIDTLDERIVSLQEAVTLLDTGRRNHEYTVITVLGQTFEQLERDANLCVGQSMFETGTTRVVTEIDPNAPTGDPSLTPVIADQGSIPYIPPAGSPGP